MNIKETLRSILIFFHLDLTKNLKYDRLTNYILKKVIQPNHNCIDVGCHKGEILNIILRQSPEGKHYAFEPLPDFYTLLEKKYSKQATIYPYALSDKTGESFFHHIKNAPAYSGIKKRRYDIKNPEIEEIKVQLNTLDNLIPENEHIHFLKIDVEGGEFEVIKGGEKLLQKCKPIILFECGKGGSDYYGTKPREIYDYLVSKIGLDIYTLSDFIKKENAMNRDKFESYFNSNEEYYFIAANASLKI